MTESMWHTLIVRAWRDGDGFKVRFTTRSGDQARSTVVEASVEDACQRFDAWLRSAEADPTPPAVTPPRTRRRRTHRDDGRETGGQTAAP